MGQHETTCCCSAAVRQNVGIATPCPVCGQSDNHGHCLNADAYWTEVMKDRPALKRFMLRKVVMSQDSADLSGLSDDNLMSAGYVKSKNGMWELQ